MNNLARAYLFALGGLLLLLITLLIVFHVAMLAGSAWEPNGYAFAVFFGINLPVIGLAKERNVWANELKECPHWLQIICRSMFVYAMLVSVACVIGNMHIPKNFFLATSAFALMFTVMSAGVLFASIKRAFTKSSDLLERTRRSLVTVVVGCTICLFIYLLPNKH